MRKASQDGGDSSSITSGLDNDIKKPGAGILKTKKTSIKRKVQNFSLDSDDGVGEPLLQKDKERIECGNQSAKFFMSKPKTDSMTDKSDEKEKLLDDNKPSVPSMTSVVGITDNRVFANGVKDNQMTKTYASAAPIHIHMNTNVFASSSRDEVSSMPKTQILVQIDGQKQKSYSPSPLIFTTAKIHTDGKTNPLPVHVTPLPILSTIEGRSVKIETASQNLQDQNVYETSKKDNVVGFALKVNTTNINDDHGNATNTVSYAGVVEKTVVPSTGYGCQPFVVTELRTFKYIPSEGTLKDITASKSTVTTCGNNTQVKDSVTEAVKSGITCKNYALHISTTVTIATKTISPPENRSSKTFSQRPLDSCLSRETEMDVNKNIQSENVSISLKSDKVVSVNPKVIDKDNTLGNKPLQRQNNTTMENKVEVSKGTTSTKIIGEKFKDLSNNKSVENVGLNTKKVYFDPPIINTGSNTVSDSVTAVPSITTIPSAQNSVLVTTLPKSVSMSSSTSMKTETKFTITSAPLTTVCIKPTTNKPSPVEVLSSSRPVSYVAFVESIPKQIKQNGTNTSSKTSIIPVAKSSSLIQKDTESIKSLPTISPSDILKTTSNLNGKSTEMPISSTKVAKIPSTVSSVSDTGKSQIMTIAANKTPLICHTTSNIPLATNALSNIAKATTPSSSQAVSNIPLSISSKTVDLKTQKATIKPSMTQMSEVKSPEATTVKTVSSGVSSVKSTEISVPSKPSTVTTIITLTTRVSPKSTIENVKATTSKPVVNKKNNETSNETPDAKK